MENIMVIGINKKNEIKQIYEITDKDLKKIELNKFSVFFPFEKFSDKKILSYCYEQTEFGVKTYPYKKNKEE